MSVACFIWWASSPDVWLLCTSASKLLPFFYRNSSHKDLGASTLDYGAGVVLSPHKDPRLLPEVRWAFSIKVVSKQKSTDWSLTIPATRRKLCRITVEALSFPTPGFCLSELRVPSEKHVLSFIQQAFAEHLIYSGIYRRLWVYGEQERCDSCPHGA